MTNTVRRRICLSCPAGVLPYLTEQLQQANILVPVCVIWSLHVLVTYSPIHIPKRLHKQTPLVQFYVSMQPGLSNQNDQGRDDNEHPKNARVHRLAILARHILLHANRESVEQQAGKNF